MDQVRRIRALTDCGANMAALQAEHSAIEDGLDTLDQAVLAGAPPEQLTRIVDIIIHFHEAHFSNEEEAFRDSGYPALDTHVKAHAIMLQKLRAARSAISEGQPEASLDVSDLLNTFHDHVAILDRPAHAYLVRQGMQHGGDTAHRQTELDRIMRPSL
jgi:hemerythrin-like metal-binding protein